MISTLMVANIHRGMRSSHPSARVGHHQCGHSNCLERNPWPKRCRQSIADQEPWVCHRLTNQWPKKAEICTTHPPIMFTEYNNWRPVTKLHSLTNSCSRFDGVALCIKKPSDSTVKSFGANGTRPSVLINNFNSIFGDYASSRVDV